MLCPVCEQDELASVQLTDSATVYRLCPECDSMWPQDTAPNIERFEQLETVLNTRGLEWADVARMPPDA